jgi:hypothetical protein
MWVLDTVGLDTVEEDGISFGKYSYIFFKVTLDSL